MRELDRLEGEQANNYGCGGEEWEESLIIE